MAGVQVKKAVVVCFLEAVKQTLEQIANHRLENSQRTETQGQEIARLYGEARRLRDYLQRCASTPQENVEIDLAPADQSLLVACCRRAIDTIEVRLSGDRIVGADEKQWLQTKRQALADWALELALKPLLELPLPRVSQSPTEAGRTLLARLQTKLFGDVNQRDKIRAPTAGINSMAAGLAVVPGPQGPAPQAAPTAEETPRAARAAFGLPEATEMPPLLLSQQLKDHRLRSLVVSDLIALGRAREARDHRIATVLLASVLEAAVVDHALTRRPELALTGTPEAWDPQGLLVRVMGDAFSPKDRAISYHLFSSRNLLRPALQMMSPVVVTQASFQQAYEFAQRALHAMGFATGSAAAGDHAVEARKGAPENATPGA